MNRQQKRQQERQFKKELKKKTKALDKISASPLEKKKVAASNWVMSLSEEECKLLNFLIDENSKIDLYAFDDAYTRILDVYLEENNLPHSDLERIHNLVGEEGEYTRKYNQKGEEYIMKIAELKPQIENRYEELKKEGKADKEIMNTLTMEFSQVTTNAVKKIVNEYKRSKVTDEDIEKAAESIFKETEKVEEPSQANLSNEKIKKISNSFKVKKLVVEDEEGIEYTKENDVVTVGEISFKDVKEVEEFREASLKEYDDKCEKELADIKKVYADKKVKFSKKVNNILDVMAM